MSVTLFPISAPPFIPPAPAPPRPLLPEATLEKAVFLHLAVLIVVTSWFYAGQSPGARIWVQLWGALGGGLFVAALLWPDADRRARRRSARHLLWPLLLFNLLAVAGSLNPVLRPIVREGIPFLMLTEAPHAWLPACARPALALSQLWLLNGVVLSCANAALVLRRRHRLRQLLGLVVLNAFALAVLGTFQKLIGASGLWFGEVPSPQRFFFSTFVYHNHWSAFILLSTAAALGLLFHWWSHPGLSRSRHTPLLLGLVAVGALVLTVPLSASRSGTLLLGALLGLAFVHSLWRLRRRYRLHQHAVYWPVTGMVFCLLLVGAATAFLARDILRQRIHLSARQIEHLQENPAGDSRLLLYRDTLRMAAVRPWFGWGLESYRDVFRIYNSQRTIEVWFGQPFYRAAHSDWLQCLAENGAVGTALIFLLIFLPLRRVWRREVDSRLAHYLVLGCALTLVYAGLEFPFANSSVLIAFWSQLYLSARYAELETPHPYTRPPFLR